MSGIFKKRKNWATVPLLAFFAVCLIGVPFLIHQKSGLVILKSNIRNIENQETLDVYHISFVIKNAGRGEKKTSATAEIGIKAISAYGDMGEKYTGFQVLGAKSFDFFLKANEEREVVGTVSIDKKEYVKAIGARSLPMLRVTIR